MDLFEQHVAIKLRDTMKLVQSGRVPHDDTLLEKLLSWIQSLVINSESSNWFISTVDLSNYCNAFTNSSEILPWEAWSYLLRLTGHIWKHAATHPMHDSTFMDSVKVLFDSVCHNESLWCESSIRAAWLVGLTSALPACRDVAYSHGYLERVSECVMDRSWFVSKAAKSLSVNLLEFPDDRSNSPTDGEILTSSRNVITSESFVHFKNYLFAPLIVGMDSLPPEDSSRRLSTCLEITDKLCQLGVDKLLTRLNISPEPLIAQLCFLLKTIATSSDSHSTDLLKPLLDVLAHLLSSDVCRTDIHRQVSLVVNSCLAESDRILASINISTWAVNSFLNRDNVDIFRQVCRLPLVACDCVKSDAGNPDIGNIDVTVWNSCIETLKADKRLHLAALKLSVCHQPQRIGSSDDLLQAVNGLSALLAQSFDPCSRAGRLSHNTRLRLWCCDAIMQLLRNAGMQNGCLASLFTVLATVIDKSLHDHALMAKTFDLSLVTIELAAASEANTSSVGEELTKFETSLCATVQKCLCCVDWNLRDTALQFLQNVFTKASAGVKPLESWATEAGLHQVAWRSLEDAEGYVRASAVSALCSLYDSNVMWMDFTTKFTDEQVFFQRLLELCRDDASEFVRRSAVVFLAKWRPTSTALQDQLRVAHEVLVHDLDWEVKREAVKFWEIFAENVSRRQDADSKTDLFESSRCIESLLVGATDCDRAVRVAAVTAVLRIRKISVGDGFATRTLRCSHEIDGSRHLNATELLLEINELLPVLASRKSLSVDDHSNRSKNGLKADADCPSGLPPEAGTKSDCIANHFDLPVNGCQAAVDDQRSVESRSVSPELGLGVENKASVVDGMWCVVLHSDWETLLALESAASDDCHTVCPESLLDDILKSVEIETMDSDTDDDEHEEIVIDCY